MNNETVAVRLEKERLANLTCIRASEKYKMQWLKVELVTSKRDIQIITVLEQNGKLYSGDVFSDKTSSALLLQGSVDEIGNYTCHWNNSLGQARFKSFFVTHVDETKLKSPETIAISVPLAILLLISIAVGVQIYLKKVSRTIIESKLTIY